MSKAQDCRATAARCLASVSKGSSLSQQIPEFEAQVSERDRALFRQLCYGVLRWQPKLEGLSGQLLQKPFKTKDCDIHMLILLGIYQLSDMRIPDHAAVSATVNATRALKKPWAKNLVNGVLRQWQRNREQLEQQLSPAQQLAHPEWLHQAIQNAWPEQAEQIQNANNQHPPMCLRVNSQKSTRDDYLQQLLNADIAAQACSHAPAGIRLQQATGVQQLPQFAEGWVSVQDEAPQLGVALLDLQPGQRVLDMCCAPGGKTCHMLEAQPELAQLLAVDIDQQRLLRVGENLQRLHLQAELKCSDATQLDDWWDGQPFDRILLDAPCSGTGVIRRNPDIKAHRRPEDIVQLAELQLEILTALWPSLKPGGLLLYATCSILPDENELVVAAFCQQQADAEHCPIAAEWGLERPYGRQLFPQPDGHDGFYYALLRKA
ncbi:16S rRNA (cytosine(967)-C(5))-methyltransferase RsmB [Dasania marina]|uniref:16S rRNA (cytosine(967)-C(5))-methyltransferase RsmB n=1 Tax=Dasania marina TaxID=471499 RepID=UPI0030D72522|tara:strand:+ start:4164 stop:5462 length:1299 start_codon:yes stop_codon:yes gene_type:complete